jgi:type VI secretion system ImpA family protein
MIHVLKPTTQSPPPDDDAIARLLVAIEPDRPAGDSLRYSEVYDAINAAQSEDDSLPQGVWQRAEKRADWPRVEKLCINALQHGTKDLQIACWLGEAWMQLYALDGLSAALRLIADFHRVFLLDMYPVETPGAPLTAEVIEHRANMIQVLNRRLGLLLKFVGLSSPSEDLVPPYTLADVEQAHYNEQVFRRRNEKYIAPPTEDFPRSASLTAPEFYRDLDRRLRRIAAEARELDELLDAAYARQNGGLGDILAAIAAIEQQIAPHVPEPELEPEAEMEAPLDLQVEPKEPTEFAANLERTEGEASHAMDSEYDRGALATVSQTNRKLTMTALSETTGVVPTPATREEAYEGLRRIAEFLARTEPHSPVPYLLRRAIRWGSLSLSELLPELLNNPEGLENVRQLLRTGEQQPQSIV